MLLCILVLRSQHLMSRLLCGMSHCNGSTMAMLLGAPATGDNRLFRGDPITMGDALFHLLCTLNSTATTTTLILKPVFNFLSGGK